jgi:hypothetical protein
MDYSSQENIVQHSEQDQYDLGLLSLEEKYSGGSLLL